MKTYICTTDREHTFSSRVQNSATYKIIQGKAVKGKPGVFNENDFGARVIPWLVLADIILKGNYEK